MIEIPPLPEGCILLVEVGSGAHGTGIAGGEDHDEAGAVIETAEQVLGLDGEFKTVMQRTQPEGTRSGPGDIDRTLYPLRRYVKLMLDGNPSMLQTLWCPVEHITPAGQELRDLAPAFIGRHIIPRYRGYMQGQVQRLLGTKGGGHGKRGGGKREELIEAHGYDTKYAMHAARLGFQCIELLGTGELTLPIDGSTGDWLRDVRYGRVSFDGWWEMVESLDKDMADLVTDDSIRPEPDRASVNEWLIETQLAAWQL